MINELAGQCPQRTLYSIYYVLCYNWAHKFHSGLRKIKQNIK